MAETMAALFAEGAEALFGEGWQAPASRVFAVNIRTMQRVAAAVRDGLDYPIPAGMVRDMADRLEQHASHCRMEADQLRLKLAARSDVTPPSLSSGWSQ